MKYLEFGIFMSLLDGKYHKASDLADKFEVSTKTIYRGINKLVYAGVPLTTKAGKFGGISLINSTLLNTWFFTEDELAYILNMAISANKYKPITNTILQSKIESHIKNKNFTTASKLAGSFIIDSNTWFSSGTKTNEFESIILSAISDSNKIEIEYSSNIRIIDPYCIVYKENSFYVYGFCNTRQEFRLFKLTRINSIKALDINFEKQEIDLNLKPWNNNQSFDNVSITIYANNEIKNEFDSWTSTEVIGKNLFKISAINNIGLIHRLMQYGNSIKVISPTEIINNLKNECNKIANLYN